MLIQKKKIIPLFKIGPPDIFDGISVIVVDVDVLGICEYSLGFEAG